MNSIVGLLAATALLVGGIWLTRQHGQTPTVLSVSSSPTHDFTKKSQPSINLVAGLGVENDAHAGVTDQHLSRLKLQPAQKNLRQVHLIHNEILQEHGLNPADIGENITTNGIDLLSLGRGTRLRFVTRGRKHEPIASSRAPCIVITGLRNPCPQIEKFRKGLQAKFVERDEQRKIKARKAGIMSVVEKGGQVEPGMSIIVEKPPEHIALDVV
ncbi:uncharacterized protein HMPREF1541_08859 [Cyphellophora europaea CBS 101466]|uniref:MOSC domain-containing protein n=1 Tax=Cyphellophora europaea (strain CBS 101466) TaxID=1220924 RepID=W2RJD0_CYPE1|nr:uncharacterized protein HMPREF1541_08859 [Cyphellophora europaea CBS 101466]ETN36581.1 hypothetical protein HMPREF1541_08859 [Cyphellophora europaea CBS 101466]